MPVLRHSPGRIVTTCSLFILGAALLLFQPQAMFASLGLDSSLNPQTLDYLLIFISVLCWLLGLAIYGAELLRCGWLRAMSLLEEMPLTAFLTLLFVVALVLRTVWILSIPSIPYTDYAVYDGLARNIAINQGYIDNFSPADTDDAGKLAFRPPGFPYLLAAVYRTFGYDLNNGKALILVFSVGIVMMTYFVNERVFGNKIARVAALLAALFPSMIASTSLLGTELPFTFFLLLLFWLLIKLRCTRHLGALMVIGIALGITTLIRPTIYPFTLLLPVYFYCVERKIGWALLRTVVIAVTLVLTILPWSLRNTQVLGSFVFLTTNSGVVLWEGTQTAAAGDAGKGAYLLCQGLSEVECDRTARNTAIANIAKNPVGYVRYSLVKLARLYLFDYEAIIQASHSTENDKSLSTSVRFILIGVSQAYYIVVLALMVTGIIYAFRRQRESGYVLYGLMFVFWSVIHFVFHGESRYHMPLLPLFVGFAGLCLVHWSFNKSP